MHPLGVIAILLVMTLPVLYIVGEVKQWRYLRVGAFVLLVPICVFVAWVVGMLQIFDYNARYGFASRDLIATTVQQLEAGNVEYVIECLKELEGEYHPTYENRANYDTLTEETIRQLNSRPISEIGAEQSNAPERETLPGGF